MTVKATFKVNGLALAAELAPHTRLIDLLRGPLGLTGTKEGCGNGECGACTVLLDGRPVVSCLTLALEAEGREITTVEGLGGPGGKLSRLQEAFVAHGGVQCGFCTPGMLTSAHALLERNPDPSETEVRQALTGNLCRCTGYTQIVGAIQAAAKALREDKEGGQHG
ncbi:MAG: (2Fe-2S)-binding protein [Deltaproteobacteria bacterium]|nr:(2Fe-2S)-binding protein [Deltaproteobacteria bacterium]